MEIISRVTEVNSEYIRLILAISGISDALIKQIRSILPSDSFIISKPRVFFKNRLICLCNILSLSLEYVIRIVSTPARYAPMRWSCRDSCGIFPKLIETIFSVFCSISKGVSLRAPLGRQSTLIPSRGFSCIWSTQGFGKLRV